MRDVFLVLHVASGTAALALGPLALFLVRQQRPGAVQVRGAYHWIVMVVCATAAVVSVLAWSRLWWLVPIGVLSYALALGGYLGSRHGWPLWMRAHAWGGSYIALVTALLVVSARGVSPVVEAIAWVLPAAIGVPLIVRSHTGRHGGGTGTARPSGAVGGT
jgi:hypothetical protein